MKKFYKWWKKASQANINEYHAYEGWKAAMEQVLLWGSDDDILFNKIKDEIYGE